MFRFFVVSFPYRERFSNFQNIGLRKKFVWSIERSKCTRKICDFFRRKTKSHPALDLRYYPPLTISFLALVDFPVPRHGGLALPGSSGGAISPLL